MNPFNAGRKRSDNPTRQAALARARRAGEKMPVMRYRDGYYLLQYREDLNTWNESESMTYWQACSRRGALLDEIAIKYGFRLTN